MKERIIHEVLQDMVLYLNNEQLEMLKRTMNCIFEDIEVIKTDKQITQAEKSNQDYIHLFISAKRIEGCSDKTLHYYIKTLQQFFLGKGNKERLVYFDARTKLTLCEYLKNRKDSNPALFVSLRAPFNRIKIGSIEARLRKMGKRLEIHKVHPHKFRRTLATMAIDKGMPIEQLQSLLGHERIDTTLQYAMVKQNNVKLAHKRFIS